MSTNGPKGFEPPERSAIRDELIASGRIDVLRAYYEDFVEAVDYLRRCERALGDVRRAVTDAQTKLLAEIARRAAS